mgnify:FL=1
MAMETIDEKESELLINRIFVFHTETGCIPQGATCYCFGIEWPFFHLYFREEILARHNLKVHFNVIKENAKLVE